MDYKEIVVPKFYRYTSEWVESNITSKYDLSATCRHPDADIQITVYIHHHGQRVVDFAKRLNLKIREVSSPEFSGYDSTAIRKVFGAFSPDCLSPDHWQTELDIVNYELAPKPVLKIISEVRDLHEKALSLYELVKSDLAAIADGMDAKNEELRQLQRDNQVGRLSHSRAIEVLHAGTKRGLSTYSLTNGCLEFTRLASPLETLTQGQRRSQHHLDFLLGSRSSLTGGLAIRTLSNSECSPS